jgi:TPR repeat protein
MLSRVKAAASVLFAAALAACSPRGEDMAPVSRAPTCPTDGCGAQPWANTGTTAPACSHGEVTACKTSSPAECTERALEAWSEAQEPGRERALACVAQMLSEACSLEDARACGFAGRLWLDGQGLSRNVPRGLSMIVQACDGGESLACLFGIRWLADPQNTADLDDAADLHARLESEYACLTGQSDACFQVGLLFYYGRDGFPRDRAKAVQAYVRGCNLGDSRACNNFADSLAYGEGVDRDLTRAAEAFAKACRLGEALGCANLGYRIEHGAGIGRDVAKARLLYREACAIGDLYGCLHADLLAAQGAGVQRDPVAVLRQWVERCDRGRDARACAFVGLIYEDGPDGLTRDPAKSLEAMTRACALGEVRGCEWVKMHRGD